MKFRICLLMLLASMLCNSASSTTFAEKPQDYYMKTVDMNFFTPLGLVAEYQSRQVEIEPGDLEVRLKLSQGNRLGDNMAVDTMLVLADAEGNALLTMIHHFSASENVENYLISQGLVLYLAVVLYEDCEGIESGSYRLVFDNTSLHGR